MYSSGWKQIPASLSHEKKWRVPQDTKDTLNKTATISGQSADLSDCPVTGLK